MRCVGDIADADTSFGAIRKDAHEFDAWVQIVRFGRRNDQVAQVFFGDGQVQMVRRVNVFGEQTRAVGCRLDGDGCDGHSIAFSIWYWRAVGVQNNYRTWRMTGVTEITR